jgi:hypothetical protein
MLNRLQKIPYRINQDILDVATFCMERRISVGKFRAEEPTAPPPPWANPSTWLRRPRSFFTSLIKMVRLLATLLLHHQSVFSSYF